jgi:hypothetical protein
MTREQRQELIEKHDALVKEYNQTDDPQALEAIGLLEMALFYDADAPVHEPCEYDDCLICMD